jgi:hypothetical protein
MTIAEVQAARAALQQQIQALLRTFETATGVHVHSVPVHHDAPQITAEVKVQLP